jgi:dipeptidyl aminopeptidase/acylaminoacyl peptidase
MRSVAFIAMLALLAVPSQAYAAPTKPFTLDDVANIVSFSDAQISPDGKKIAVVLSRPDMKGDKTKSQLELVDVATGTMRVLTPMRDRVASPQWSQDGSQLAFVASAGEGKDAKPQVWILPMDGGEAQPVTNAENGVEDYSLRPDGKALAYVSEDTPKNKKAIEKHHDLFVVGDNDFLSQAAPVPSHVWLQEISEHAKPKRLTSGNTTESGSLSWSHDGRYLTFERGPDAYGMAHFLHDRAVVYDTTNGGQHLIGQTYSNGATFAPDGTRIAYLVGRNGSSAVFNELLVAAQPSAQAHDAAPDVDRDVNWFAWMPHGDAIAFGAANRTSFDLWIATPGARAKHIDLGDVEFDSGSVASDGAIAFTGATPTDPSELYYLAPGTQALRKLTSDNAWIARDRVVARSKEFTWTNDGFDEDGALTYPANYVAGRKYPLALVIHGGPTQAESSIEFSPLVQELANRGMFVLQPNYRGSANLGFKYADAMIGPQVYVGAASDVVAGVKALEATGMIDTSRVGVSGWSGGGWMTSFLITNYPAMWTAAVSGAAVNDCVVQYSLEDVTDYLPALFGGLTPWKGNGMAAYRRNSPITHVSDVRAPTLILSDTGDYRVPEPEAYEFFKALRDQGKTVQFVAIPAYGHFPSDPVRRIDTYKRWAGWLEQHLK